MLRNKLLASWVFLMFLAVIAMGQGGTGQISGTVTDPNGAVVSGAVIKVTNTATNFTRETTTNGNGFYSVQLLRAGSYVVEITASNFGPAKARADVNITETTTL